MDTHEQAEQPVKQYTEDQVKSMLAEGGVASIVQILQQSEKLTQAQIEAYMRAADPVRAIKPSEAMTVEDYFDTENRHYERLIAQAKKIMIKERH